MIYLIKAYLSFIFFGAIFLDICLILPINVPSEIIVIVYGMLAIKTLAPLIITLYLLLDKFFIR